MIERHENGDRTIFGIRLQKTITFGNLYVAVTVLLGMAGYFWKLNDKVDRGIEDRLGIHDTINAIQADRKETKGDILKLLTALKDSDTVQNNRLENFADRLTQVLNITIEQGKQIHQQSVDYAQMHEDMMVMRYMLGQKHDARMGHDDGVRARDSDDSARPGSGPR